ncbi:Serine/threonine protein kinase [Nostoc sp. DSM 114160]|jgi:serine/threonine protein kinase
MPWITGQQLLGGKYVIEQVLGQGGFGITYKALHVELKQTVVIKTPNEYLSHDPEYEKYIERFIQEGRILARLSQDPHPHIVGVIDLFQEGATYCLVMDFVEGENLYEVVRRRGALPEGLIVPYIRQIVKALMVVHQEGLVHRDAHPGNIMLRSSGKAVLIDFGIAKELIPRTLSSTGNMAHPGFAPYEQVTRGSRKPTVDVYCLAATLYYAVTGQHPTTSLARKLENTSLTPPKRIIPGISDRLNQAILKGMALEAKDRPQSMQAWLLMLKEPVRHRPRFELIYRLIQTILNEFRQILRIVIDLIGDWYQNTIPLVQALLLGFNRMIDALFNPNSPNTVSKRWLAGLWVSYGLLTYLLVVSHAPFRTVVWAVASAIAVAMASASAMVWIEATVALVVALTSAVVWASASAFFWVWAVPSAWSSVWAFFVSIFVGRFGDELRTSFSRYHTFLILACNSALGLGLGWLAHWVLYINKSS